jgi:uncharacterized protein
MYVEHMSMKLGGAPALLCYPETPEKGGARGTVLFYHGLMASKDTNMKELTGLAREGFLAVGIDNIGHGERRFPDFDDQFSSRIEGFELRFINAVRQTIDEIPFIIDDLIKAGYSDPGKIGISGISMGGFITYGGILADRRISVAAPILGCPKWKVPHAESPHNNPEKFFPVALLAQNAGDDEHVPPRHAREFNERLKPFYEADTERNRYLEFPGEHHFMTEGAWNALWHNTLQWFSHYFE